MVTISEHSSWVKKNFVKLQPGKDYFGGGKVAGAG